MESLIVVGLLLIALVTIVLVGLHRFESNISFSLKASLIKLVTVEITATTAENRDNAH